jgi:hypothetical protein
MRTFPGAEMTREDMMREEEREEGEDALGCKLAYESALLPITSPAEYRMT